MNRKWNSYDGYIDPKLLDFLTSLNILPQKSFIVPSEQREFTIEEKRKLTAIRRKYNKGELSENKKGCKGG